MDLIDVGERVKQARKAARVTQTQLAQMSGVSRSRIDMLENGRASEIGFKYLLRIINAVGLDLRMTTLNADRPTLDDLRAEEEEIAHAARMG